MSKTRAVLVTAVAILCSVLAVQQASATTAYTKRASDYHALTYFHNVSQLVSGYRYISSSYEEVAHDSAPTVRANLVASSSLAGSEEMFVQYRLRWSNGTYTRGLCSDGRDGLWLSAAGNSRNCYTAWNISPGSASLSVTKVKFMFTWKIPVEGGVAVAQSYRVCSTHALGSGSSSCSGGGGTGSSAF